MLDRELGMRWRQRCEQVVVCIQRQRQRICSFRSQYAFKCSGRDSGGTDFDEHAPPRLESGEFALGHCRYP